MYNKAHHDFCFEFYQIEKTIEVVVEIDGKKEMIRLEALRNEKFPAEANYEYSIRSYIYKEVAGDSMWINWSRLSWEHSATADSTLQLALAQIHAFMQ